MTVLRLILGDQLSDSISSLADCDLTKDVILMCEVWEEATYVKHHKKKIAFIFSAMRHFARELSSKGYKVRYITLDEPKNTGSLTGEVARATAEYIPSKIVVTHPGEYRVLKVIEGWKENIGILVDVLPDTRFLASPDEFKAWAHGRKQVRMEYFYREMRKKYQILMAGDEPEGGKWNYDEENRKVPKSGLRIPRPFKTDIDGITREVIRLVEERFGDHFGTLDGFHFAVTRAQALQVLGHFVQHRLPQFGDYQDAMLEEEPWMFHSHLSFYLNCGLLLPLECIRAAESAYLEGGMPLNAVEGFIRQILGWREYVRGIYWLKMPGYARLNFLNAERPLPKFYWDARTEMNCLRQCVVNTRDNAYAHHIQRLMVLGNFALLAGINPDEVNEWYLLVYADAFEWVELPNVSGMILFADGGYLGSKPYAAGGSYINKMSNYCQNCRYKPNVKLGQDACPFNYLYWDFLARNRPSLESNPRLGMMYKSYDRMDAVRKSEIKAESERFLESLV